MGEPTPRWLALLGSDLTGFFKMNGAPDQLIGMFKGKLFLDPFPVGTNGFDAKKKSFCNFTGGEPPADHFKHLEFPVCEPVNRGFLPGLPGIGHGGEDMFLDLFVEINFSFQNMVDGGYHRFHGFLLHDIPPGTGGKGPLGIEIFIVHGQNQDRDVPMVEIYMFDKINPI